MPETFLRDRIWYQEKKYLVKLDVFIQKMYSICSHLENRQIHPDLPRVIEIVRRDDFALYTFRWYHYCLAYGKVHWATCHSTILVEALRRIITFSHASLLLASRLLSSSSCLNSGFALNSNSPLCCVWSNSSLSKFWPSFPPYLTVLSETHAL